MLSALFSSTEHYMAVTFTVKKVAPKTNFSSCLLLLLFVFTKKIVFFYYYVLSHNISAHNTETLQRYEFTAKRVALNVDSSASVLTRVMQSAQLAGFSFTGQPIST